MLALLLISSAAHAFAQDIPILANPSSKTVNSDIKVPEFDVASVKTNKSGERMMRIMFKPDGFACTNISLKSLVANAYGIKQDLISGATGWMDSTGYDVDAKVAGPDVEALKTLPPSRRGEMLQALLVDRFKLRVHTETKVLPIYELIVAKGGPKLKESAPMPPASEDPKPSNQEMPRRGMQTMRPGGFSGDSVGMAALANQLSYVTHRTVMDKTGLTGRYDIDLKWTPDEGAAEIAEASGDSTASIFTALQEQLGLRLQSSKGEVETLVIDHAEQPSEN